MFIANHVIQAPVDGMLHEHRPACGRLSAGDEISRPLIERAKPLFNGFPNILARTRSLERKTVEVQFVKHDAISTTGFLPLHGFKGERVNSRSVLKLSSNLASMDTKVLRAPP
jgi:hypothetical protein